MNEIDKIAKLHSTVIKNIDFNAFAKVYSDAFLNSYSNTLKAVNIIKNTDFGALANAYSNVFINSYSNTLKIVRIIKNTDFSALARAYSNAFENSYLNTLKAIDIMKKTDFNALAKVYSNAIINGYYNTQKIIDIVKNTNFDALISSYSKNLKLIDISNKINFDTINDLNSVITQTVNNFSEKTEFDDNDFEKVNNLSDFALEITYSKKLPAVIRKNILLNILQKFWNLMGIPQIGILIAIVFFCLQSFDIPQKKQKYIIRETIREIIIIEKEYHEFTLRGITNNDVIVYIKPNTRSTSVFILDCGDIVEVIKNKKKWIYIRLYNTDIEGWVLKKYTKGAKNKKVNL